MGNETRANGFLSDLQKLDEAGRDRMLSLLPAEDVILILKASLRERDRYEVNHQGNAPAADVGLPNRTAPSGPNLSTADVSHAALELDTTRRTNKRRRVIDPDSDDEDNEVYTTRSYPTKKRDHITDLDSEEHDEDSSTSIVSPEKSGNESIQPSMLPKPDVHIEPLHLHVKIPVANGRIGTKEIPAAIRTELKFRFEAMRTSSKGRVITYRSILRMPHYYMEKGRCIRSLIVNQGSAGARDPTYACGGELAKAADDRCIKSGDPCAHLVEHNGKVVICVVPLPEDYREGKTWEEIGYWIL